MLINFTVPVTSNKAELLVKIVGDPSEAFWEIAIPGTPFSNVYFCETSDSKEYSIVLASPVQSQPLSNYTSGSISLECVSEAGPPTSISAVCFVNKQDLTALQLSVDSAPPGEYDNYTTVLYPLLFGDTLEFTFPQFDKERLIPVFSDAMSIGFPGIQSGELQEVLNSYDRWPAEEIELTFPSLVSGTLATGLKTYDNWPPEEIEFTFPQLLSGELKISLLSYINWPAEELEFTLPLLTGGTLS